MEGTRVLVVVAHPDDETFGCGSVIIDAVGRGAEVVVCCATRGEAGVDVRGLVVEPDELARVREAELHAAARAMGVAEAEVLGFADSGFDGEMPVGALAAVPLDEVVDRVAGVLRRRRPHVVVTMDPVGIRDHRDHVRIGDATTRAFHDVVTWQARLYHWTLARSVIRRWSEAQRARGALEEYTELDLGRLDDEITTVLDVSAWFDRRRAAMAEHRSQGSPFDGLSDELLHELLDRAHLVRVVPAWDGGALERGLFGD